MSEIEAPSWGVPASDSSNPQILNEHGEVIKTKEDTVTQEKNFYEDLYYKEDQYILFVLIYLRCYQE